MAFFFGQGQWELDHFLPADQAKQLEQWLGELLCVEVAGENAAQGSAGGESPEADR
jgi:hypothetical protein